MKQHAFAEECLDIPLRGLPGDRDQLGDVHDLIRSMDGNMELGHAIAIADSAEWSGDMSVNLHTAIKAARIMSRELAKIRAAIG